MKLFVADDFVAGEKGRFKEAGLFDICDWIIDAYPNDVFVKEPAQIIELVLTAKEIKKKKSAGKKEARN